MEINATTVAEWLEKMNKLVVGKFTFENLTRSNLWISFSSTYDAVNNQVEATYDNGKGGAVRVCYFDFKYVDEKLVARAAVEDIKHKCARINITNMRRHGFIDCKELAERDHVAEKKLYWYFREHAKECAFYYGEPRYYGPNYNGWSHDLYDGICRVFDVGEKRQNKVGISDADEVAAAEMKKRIDTVRNTIELLDTTYSQLTATCNEVNDMFDNIKVSYMSSIARCYTNPYNKSMFAKIPCTVTIDLNKTKCPFVNLDDVCEQFLCVKYNLIYDELFDTVSAEDVDYDFGTYTNSAKIVINPQMFVHYKIAAGLDKYTAFKNNDVTISEFKTRVLDKVVERINECSAVHQLCKQFS